MEIKTLWIFLLFFFRTSHSVLKCNNEICDCFPGKELEFQCPKSLYNDDETLNRFLIHADNKGNINIDCVASPMFDKAILPNVTVKSISFCSLTTCPLPKSSFKDILDKYNPSDFKYFTFEYSNLSSVTLTKEYFAGLQNLRKLNLNSNNLVAIEEDAFANTPNITFLDLNNNQLKLKKNLFNNTRLLTVLDLSENGLTELPAGIFQPLHKLKELQFRNNRLTEINNQTFDGLFRLELLELTGNNIEIISDDAFYKLTELTQINLQSNKIEFLPNNLFINNKKLNLTRLSNNKVKMILPEQCFGNLPLLKEVDLTNARIDSVPHNLFQNSTNIAKIILVKNNLSSLPHNIFAGLDNLKEIHLSYNQIVNITHVFASLNRLKTLSLAHNNIKELEKNAFADLHNLEEIDLSHNNISIIADSIFKDTINLKIINLSHNFYKKREEFRILENVVHAETIDLSYNSISWIDDVISLNNKINLTILNLSNNRIEHLRMQDVVPVSQNFKILLNNNSISTIDIENVKKMNMRSKTKVFLNYNPLNCNCSIFDFIDNHSKLKAFELNMDQLVCANPPKLRNTPVNKLNSAQLVCSFKEMDDGTTNCPDNCSCEWKPYDNSILVNCSRRNLNNLPELKFNLSSQYPINEIELDLEGNNLVAGPSSNVTGYKKVTKLYLSHNQIRRISWIPNGIKVLTLHNNNLTQMDYYFLHRLNTTDFSNLTLHNNSWDCSCEAYTLTEFLKQHGKQVDVKSVFCSNSSKLLINLNKDDVCHEWKLVYTILLVVAVFLLAAVVAAVYYRYRETIDAWLYINGYCRSYIDRIEEENKTYDVFISYSHKDEEFVTGTLLPVLESGPYPFKVCIHFRDFTPGEFISEQVTNAVLDSRRTLVVLSPNYLESVWGKMEFRTAHTKAMQDGQTRVILILYKDVDSKKLDPELELYTKTNTYLKWEDSYFWTKLLYALPHKDKYVKVKRRQANVTCFKDETVKLVHDGQSSSSPKICPDKNNSKPDLLDFVPSIEISIPS